MCHLRVVCQCAMGLQWLCVCVRIAGGRDCVRCKRVWAETYVILWRALGSEPPPAIVEMWCGAGLRGRCQLREGRVDVGVRRWAGWSFFVCQGIGALERMGNGPAGGSKHGGDWRWGSGSSRQPCDADMRSRLYGVHGFVRADGRWLDSLLCSTPRHSITRPRPSHPARKCPAECATYRSRRHRCPQYSSTRPP